MSEIPAILADELDPVWKALSDPTRRAILDFLRPGSRTTTAIVEAFPHITRFGVMKHLDVLRESHLVETRDAGRQRINSLNVVPIRQIYERWVGPFQELWSSELLRIRDLAENRSQPSPQTPKPGAKPSAQPNNPKQRKRQRKRKKGPATRIGL